MAGDPSDETIRADAGVARAQYVLALLSDDAENAFIVLAAKQIAGAGTKTVALVNVPTHLDKIKRVGPDLVFSLQLLGAEILARTLSGETFDSAMISQLLFAKARSEEQTYEHQSLMRI